MSSPEAQRYIVAPLLYQQAAGEAVRSSLRTIHNTLQGKIVRSEHESGPKVLSLSALEAAVVKERFPGLLVEPDIRHSMARSPLCPPLEPVMVPAAGSKTLKIEVKGDGAPVSGARVMVFTNLQERAGYEGVTGTDGALRLSVRSSDSSYPLIVILPAAGFWSRTLTAAPFQQELSISLKPLAISGFDWGLSVTDAPARGERGGRDIKVAVIDSGIGPHGSLRVVDGKNLIREEAADAWQDLDGHGTHCAGVIAALAVAASTWGYAPNVSLYALRVFGGPDGGGFASDIGDAIDWAVEAGCDIVSMSLTSETASSYMRGKIEKATDRGVLCVAAAGNEGGAVGYPAKFRNVVGVSAIGKEGTFPADSVHADALGAVRSGDQQYFFASFSNRGEEIDLCGPGVAITSTLPGESFAAWDGTSMACPHIAGIAALALEASPAIRNAPRDAERMGLLSDRLLGLCTDLGMPLPYQGSGMPKLGALFSA
ncbi:MAG: S8 family serine peptidase [Thermoanaerobaculia bacterium]